MILFILGTLIFNKYHNRGVGYPKQNYTTDISPTPIHVPILPKSAQQGRIVDKKFIDHSLNVYPKSSVTIAFRSRNGLDSQSLFRWVLKSIISVK